MDHLVLTIIAADKPGVVERIAQNIAAHGGNWLESRMAHMAGQFAGILRVSVPAENRQALVGAEQVPSVRRDVPRTDMGWENYAPDLRDLLLRLERDRARRSTNRAHRSAALRGEPLHVGRAAAGAGGQRHRVTGDRQGAQQVRVDDEGRGSVAGLERPQRAEQQPVLLQPDLGQLVPIVRGRRGRSIGAD